MVTLVYDCPRCDAKKITLDIKAVHHIVGYFFEIYIICRKCKEGSIFKLNGDNTISSILIRCVSEESFINEQRIDISDNVITLELVSLKHMAAQKAPEHVPPHIEEAFNEAATCFATECYNATVAISRSCLDLMTKFLMPPNAKHINNLKPRMDYLFSQDILPKPLQKQSECIKDNGNEAVHECNMDKDIAEDTLVFTERLLQYVFTFNAQIENDEKKRIERKRLKKCN